jgi:sugar phosphate isomerase/epimerase
MNIELSNGRYYDIEPLKNPPQNPSQNILAIHCRGFQNLKDLKSVLQNENINILEIKSEKFEGNDALFYWDNMGKTLHPNFPNLEKIKNESLKYNFGIQFHIPFGKIEGTLLNSGNKEDHIKLSNVINAYVDIIDKYQLQKSFPNNRVNLVIHPPDTPDHTKIDCIKEILSVSNEFFVNLGDQAKTQNWPITICLENQPDPFAYNSLGYLEEHLFTLVKNTNEFIQFCIDSGHRLLAKDFKVQDIVDWCQKNNKAIFNFHFHSNDGLVSNLLDAHNFPDPDKIHGFMRYILRAVYENIPLNLEISERRPTIEQIKPYREIIDDVSIQIKKSLNSIQM